jgi:hypothetical protein
MEETMARRDERFEQMIDEAEIEDFLKSIFNMEDDAQPVAHAEFRPGRKWRFNSKGFTVGTLREMVSAMPASILEMAYNSLPDNAPKDEIMSSLVAGYLMNTIYTIEQMLDNEVLCDEADYLLKFFRDVVNLNDEFMREQEGNVTIIRTVGR